MNGVHDLGGMDGFGPVVRERDEPVFHEPWERRVFAMLLATMGQGLYNLDEMRHAIERMSPAHYLGSTYYEHWLTGLETILLEKGRLTPEEIEDRLTAMAGGEHTVAERQDPKLTGWLGHVIAQGGSSARKGGRSRFKPGDAVRVRTMNPAGHTRCPRYVRGKSGVVERAYPSFVLPDANAHGDGDKAEPVYAVRFDSRELWGQEASGDSVYVDLWESYLEAPRAASGGKPRRKAAAKTRKRVKPKAKRGRSKR